MGTDVDQLTKQLHNALVCIGELTIQNRLQQIELNETRQHVYELQQQAGQNA